MGRISTFNLKQAAAICERLSVGETLRSICRDEAMPAWRTVYDWISADKEFAARIAHARDLGFDAIAESTIEIADDGLNDTYRDEQGNVRTDQDVIARSKLRIETRLKLLAKWSPKRYGDKQAVELTGADNGPIQIERKAERISELMAIAATRKTKQDEDLDGLV
jgi:hypothetical protein